MDIYAIAEEQNTAEDEALKALVASIVPLPKGILPSTIFMKRTREIILSLNQSGMSKAA